jgi:hypothetical protein
VRVMSKRPQNPARPVEIGRAKAQFQKSWDAWKAWAKLEEVPGDRDRVTAFQPLGASPRFPAGLFFASGES